MSLTARRLTTAIACILVASAAGAQPDNKKPDPTADKAREIATQPARDLGAQKIKVPPVLQNAIAAPYNMKGAANCRQIAASVAQLNEVLGPDFTAGAQTNENRASKIAEAGGKTIVNSLLPFRGLVREVTGAAPAQRRLNAAIDAGYARRGFLRGLQQARKCRR